MRVVISAEVGSSTSTGWASDGRTLLDPKGGFVLVMHRDEKLHEAILRFDGRDRGRLIIALKKAICATFGASEWKELAYLTGTEEYVRGHSRLLRSLHWGDDDYPSHVLDAVEHILNVDPGNLAILLDYGEVGSWLRENAPDAHRLVSGLEPAGLEHAEQEAGAGRDFDIAAEIRRIRESVDEDPALALGSTKELLESVCKTVLGIHGSVAADDLPKLFRRVQDELDVHPDKVDDRMEGAKQMRRFMGSMSAMVTSVVELRNRYGTGHGRSRSPALEPEAARFAVSAGTALATYVMERYTKLKAAGRLVGRARTA